MYGDDFLLGMRVLGQSLRESQTTRDLVAVVVGSHVSDLSKNVLRKDGWIVHEVDAVQNPGLWTGTASGSFPPRFWAVYTKLLVFNLTQYERVVYLDADTIALRNLDALFLCDGLCGVMRHSERLNSGVMVLQPQAQLFSDMMSRIEQTPSYTGGDQGFLNAYFSGFAASPLFDPGRGRLLSESWARPPPGNATGGAAARVRMGRLPTEYNADLGLYVLNSNRWMVPEVDSQGIVGAGWVSPQQHRARDLNGGCVSKRRWVSESLPPCARLRLRLPYIPGAVVVQHLHPKPPGTLRAPLTPLLSFLPTPHQDELFVLHFTLSSFKPWNWWSSWIISGNMERWQALRRRLPGPDTGPSRLLVSTLAAGPWLLFALFMRRTPSLSPCLRNLSFRRGAPGMSGALALERVACMPWVILLAALTSLCLAVGFAVCLVPTQVDPMWGWMLAYEWIAVSFAALFGASLWAVYQWGFGLRQAGNNISSVEGDGRLFLAASAGNLWQQTALAFGVTLGLLGILPWWSDVLGLKSFTGRLFSMGAAIAPTTLVVGHLLSSLALSWFHAGLSMASPASPKLKHPV
ncbi:PGSIP6 [Auxenochlorella protothecoides x Auxenochlorella symbiontica]